jgi:hypothetical protein
MSIPTYFPKIIKDHILSGKKEICLHSSYPVKFNIDIKDYPSTLEELKQKKHQELDKEIQNDLQNGLMTQEEAVRYRKYRENSYDLINVGTNGCSYYTVLKLSTKKIYHLCGDDIDWKTEEITEDELKYGISIE